MTLQQARAELNARGYSSRPHLDEVARSVATQRDYAPLAALWDRAVTPLLLELAETARIAGLDVPEHITFKATLSNGCVALTVIDPHS